MLQIVTKQTPVNRADLISRKHELEDRKAKLRLEKISVLKRLGEVEAAEAALRYEEELAASADRILARRNFAQAFCKSYARNKKIAERVEALAEAILATIQALYPAWMADIAAATSVAVLCSYVLARRGVDLFCRG